MVVPVSDRISRVPSYSGKSVARQGDVADGAITLSGRPFQNRLAIVLLGNLRPAPQCRDTLYPQPHRSNACGLLNSYGLGFVPVRSPLLRESLLMSFPPGTEMFQFSGLASPGYVLT